MKWYDDDDDEDDDDDDDCCSVLLPLSFKSRCAVTVIIYSDC